MKHKNNFKYLIIWLSFATIFAIIIFFLFIKNNKNNNDISNDLIENNINLYPLKNDDDVISFDINKTILNSNLNLNSNFEEIQLKHKIIPYYVKCKTYDSDNYICKEATVSVLNIQFDVELDYNSCSSSNEILWVNKYLIHQFTADCSAACGYINVSYDDKEIYNIRNVIASSEITESNDYNYAKYHDKYLYYFVDGGEDIYLKKLNLDGNEFKEEIIGKIKNTYYKCGI